MQRGNGEATGRLTSDPTGSDMGRSRPREGRRRAHRLSVLFGLRKTPPGHCPTCPSPFPKVTDRARASTVKTLLRRQRSPDSQKTRQGAGPTGVPPAARYPCFGPYVSPWQAFWGGPPSETGIILPIGAGLPPDRARCTALSAVPRSSAVRPSECTTRAGRSMASGPHRNLVVTTGGAIHRRSDPGGWQ